ncbi:peptidase M16 inactive domain-containing protein [Bisporella sp. PMI_857]|nr:peptidase M16 inactive domain-containing protein [Bisporella sp. PMI_857]
MLKCSSRSLARGLTASKEGIQKVSSFEILANLLVLTRTLQDPAELDEISTLSNGIRVATEALPGHFSGIGVYIDAGSRYENDYYKGVSHIMDRDEMLEALESLGGNIQCASSRESLMYQSATFNSAVPTTVALLAETIREPLITEEEVLLQLDTAAYEIGEIWSKPDLILPELVHMAAYKDNTLGNPLLCPKERLGQIDKSVIEAYRKVFYTPERMVIAFAGVEHREAVRLAEQYFGDIPTSELPSLSRTGSETSLGSTYSESSDSSISSSIPPSPTQQPSKLLSRLPFLKNISTSAPLNASVQSMTDLYPSSTDILKPSYYTGGFLSLPPLPPPINPSIPPLTHIHLAFEALPVSSDDIYALATLQTLLGGGGSFSAGGPGKGMYSRLYTNVLNQHGWVESCIAFNHSYTDSGLFGISASCSPGKVAPMLDVMCRELQALTLDSGAKNQLRSSLLMNLESRMVELEDLGRQVQVHGRKVGVREMYLRRVAKVVVGGMVNNAGKGSGARLRKFKWDEIQDRIDKWKLGRR